ncbi:uncharacterized protein C9orf85 homolog [Stylophora pistillata]|uniref:Uncharacterized protein C9orf85-like n=1 Tax=Stylophora pistillata TaxID=50429 RepID=A0A2B4SKJ7_STYPI|nr:uncharacterized protein C9orf85 homolog [Stylophora pistillata]PFX29098.1 Uncharacterized protein C9orf85-like [Stylophora pistillata]
MSTNKGNNSKKGQKHQNKKAFKNNLHDTSKKTKQINSLKVGGVCSRCREIIEWRKKFKKYKPLTAPKKCVRCEQKTIKHAYHTVCSKCAQQAGVCEKCGEVREITAKSEPTPAERASEDSMLQQEIKSMTERQRRTFFRHHEGDRGDLSQVACASNTSDLSSNEDDDAEMSEPDESVDNELLGP